jgi:glutamine amidotransferase PdxT
MLLTNLTLALGLIGTSAVGTMATVQTCQNNVRVMKKDKALKVVDVEVKRNHYSKSTT